jgi:peptidoglycan-associated lipoprotein
MKKSLIWTVLFSISTMLLFDSCQKKNNSNDVWDDSNSLGSYKRAKERVLWGNPQETEVAKADEKEFAASDEDFIPLQDEDLKQQFSDLAIPQPKDSPGEPGSFLPGIDGFQQPSSDIAYLFRTVYFNTDEYVLKSSDSLESIDRMAAYLKAHPKTYIFVEGHCDQRGPEAYNLALGTRRANYVRTLLVQKGVNPEQIHTISYGKERLADFDNSPSAWAKNRRAQFKIYQQR